MLDGYCIRRKKSCDWREGGGGKEERRKEKPKQIVDEIKASGKMKKNKYKGNEQMTVESETNSANSFSFLFFFITLSDHFRNLSQF